MATKIDNSTQYYHGNKFRIYPTKEQAEFMEECIDVARYVYNWAIEQEEKQYQLYLDGKVGKEESFLTAFQLDHMFVEHRHKHQWLEKYPLGFTRYAIENAVQAYRNFFKRLCKKPTFKSKKLTKPSYHPRSERMYIRNGNMLQIEGLSKDLIKIDDLVLNYDFDNVHFANPTISRDKIGNYYVSFTILKDKPLSYFEDNNISQSQILGIDLNLRKDARVVCSDGTRFTAPDIRKYEKKIKRLSRKCGKDINRHKELERVNPDKIIEPSKRSIKRRLALRKYFRKITNINKTFAFTVARRIINKNPKAIVMEGLDIVNEFETKHYFAKYIQFNPLYDIRLKIQEKCNMYNVPFMLASKDYPSTQMCSNCGHIKKMYSSKTYICHNCGMRMDRDDNAALNLERLAYTVDFTNMSNINLATI